jgi:O-antigen ligase
VTHAALSVSAAGGARLVGARDRGWDAMNVCIATYVLAAVSRIHQLFPILGALHPALVASIVATALLTLDPRCARRIGAVGRLGPVRWLGLLFLWAALTIPFALWPGRAFSVVTDDLGKAVAMVVVLVAAVRSMADVERLVATLVAGTVTYAAVVVARFDITTTGDRLSSLYYYDANDFALLIVVTLPFALYMVRFARSTALRIGALLGVALLCTAFVRTGSRGGFLALLVVVVLLVTGFTAINWRWRLGLAAALATGIAVASSTEFWTRMGTITSSESDYNRTDDEGRLKVWRRGVGYMLQRPLTGVGAGNFPIAEGTLSPLAERQERSVGVKWSAAHNTFVQVAAELGVPGLACFLAAIGGTFRRVRRVARRATGTRERALAQASAIALLGFSTGAIFLSFAYADILYVLLALGLAIVSTAVTVPREAHG